MKKYAQEKIDGDDASKQGIIQMNCELHCNDGVNCSVTNGTTCHVFYKFYVSVDKMEEIYTAIAKFHDNYTGLGRVYSGQTHDKISTLFYKR